MPVGAQRIVCCSEHGPVKLFGSAWALMMKTLMRAKNITPPANGNPGRNPDPGGGLDRGVPTSGVRDLAFPKSTGVIVTGFLGLALPKSGFWIL